MGGQKGLVGGDDMLALLECVQDERLRRLGTTYELDDDVDLPVIDQGTGICGEHALGDLHPVILRDIDVGDALEVQCKPEPVFEQGAVFEQGLGNPGADGAQSNEAYLNLVHGISLFSKHACSLRTDRIASRTSPARYELLTKGPATQYTMPSDLARLDHLS